MKEGDEASLPDVKQSVTELVPDRISSPYLGNVETNRNHFRGCYNSMTAQLCSHFVILLERNTQAIRKFKTNSFLMSLYPQSDLMTYPVFKIWEIATSSSTSETRWGTSGCPKRTLAQRAPPAATGCHKPSTAEPPSSSVVSERDAKCLWIHASLFCPGWPPLPDRKWPHGVNRIPDKTS